MNDLAKFRKNIDTIDEKISFLLKERLKNIKEIKEIKLKNGFKIEDQKREQEIIEKLDSEFEKNIFKKILEESKKNQI